MVKLETGNLKLDKQSNPYHKARPRYVAEKTSLGALELKKSPSSLRKYGLWKSLKQVSSFQFQ